MYTHKYTLKGNFVVISVSCQVFKEFSDFIFSVSSLIWSVTDQLLLQSVLRVKDEPK